MSMYTSEVTTAGHTKRVTITRRTTGWEVCEEHDSKVVRTANYLDWHRVERAIEIFKLAEVVRESRA